MQSNTTASLDVNHSRVMYLTKYWCFNAHLFGVVKYVTHVDLEASNPKLHRARLRDIAAHPALRLNSLHGVDNYLMQCTC